jgi:hypothetical protein
VAPVVRLAVRPSRRVLLVLASVLVRALVLVRERLVVRLV